MAGCKSYLRGLAICVTVLLLVSGIVMIGVGFSPIDGNTPVAKLFQQLSVSDGLLVLQVFGPITIILSVVGICAAILDLKPLLLVFSALLFVEFVAMVVVASPLVQVQAEMDPVVEGIFLNVTPLHKTQPEIQRELNKLQASDSCCGLRSSKDWENQLPVSCSCTLPVTNSSSECELVESDSNQAGKSWVHSKPCGPILKSYLNFPIKLRIGIISAFATIAMAAIAVCVILGLEKHWKTPPVESTVDDYNRVKYQPKPCVT